MGEGGVRWLLLLPRSVCARVCACGGDGEGEPESLGTATAAAAAAGLWTDGPPVGRADGRLESAGVARQRAEL